jgi:PAS domain S-box-containing protein
MRQDQSTFWADAHIVTIDLADGPANLGFFSDITQRKRDQDALRESEQRFREIAETIGEVFWIVNPTERRTLYVSPSYEKVWGRPRSEAYRSAEAFVAAVHPDDRDRVQDAVTTKTVTGDYNEVYRIVRPNGAVRWIRDRAFPVKDGSGEVRRVIGVATDITEQRDLEAQLLHAQKMEAIGALAEGVAHDFNDIVSVILDQTKAIRERAGADQPLAEHVAEVEKAARRGASLTQELLAFGSKQVFEPQVLALDRVVAAAESLLLRVVGKDIELRVVPYHGELRVRVDPRQIEQVLMNLAVNARDAMPEGGKLTVELGRTEVRASEAARMDLKPGPHAILSVIDSGVGMDAATKARIFEPFFTTKGMGQGTGLGLAAVFGIVRQSGGHVAVASSPGKGTAFRIFLPLTIAELAAASVLARRPSP